MNEDLVKPSVEQLETTAAAGPLPLRTSVIPLKYYIHDHSHLFRLELIGGLTHTEIAEVDGCWRTARSSLAGRRICIDLRGVIEIDDAGKAWLSEMSTSTELEFMALRSFIDRFPDVPLAGGESPAPVPRARRAERLASLFGLRSKKSVVKSPPHSAPITKSVANESESDLSFKSRSVSI